MHRGQGLLDRRLTLGAPGRERGQGSDVEDLALKLADIRRFEHVFMQSGIIADIPAEATVSGYPARPHRELLRAQAAMYRLAKIVDELEALVEQVRAAEAHLEERSNNPTPAGSAANGGRTNRAPNGRPIAIKEK